MLFTFYVYYIYRIQGVTQKNAFIVTDNSSHHWYYSIKIVVNVSMKSHSYYVPTAIETINIKIIVLYKNNSFLYAPLLFTFKIPNHESVGSNVD